MAAPIEFWFDFSSPYAYIASEWVEALAMHCAKESIPLDFVTSHTYGRQLPPAASTAAWAGARSDRSRSVTHTSNPDAASSTAVARPIAGQRVLLVRPDQHAAVFRHSQRLVAHAHAAHAFEHEIEFLRPHMLVQRIRAFRGQPPQPQTNLVRQETRWPLACL